VKAKGLRSTHIRVDQQTVIASYNEHYATAGQLRDTDAFYQWVLALMDVQVPGPLLDVACGEGHLVKYALQQGIDAVGIDFSPKAVSLAQRTARANIISVADAENLPFAGDTFRYVTNLGSLEHFVHPEHGLAEMRRVLSADGLLALILPNSYYLLDIVWHVWRRGYPVSHRQEIERFGTIGEWRDLIEENGLHVERVHKYNLCLPRTPHDWKWYIRSPLKFAYPLTSPFVPLNLSYSFLYLCRIA
jgi:SAM-dependent methyltransferase